MTAQVKPKVWHLRILSMIFMLLIGSAVGAYLAYIQPQHKVFTTTLEPPRVSDLNNYFSLFTTYRLVNDESKMTDQQVSDMVYQEFIKQLSSPELLKGYLQEQTLVQNLAHYNDIELTQQVEQFAQAFQFNPQSQATQLTFTSPINNPTLAIELMQGIVQKANQQAKQELYADLVHKWKVLFQQVKLAADNNLAESWKGKLQIMLSVQPLDDKLVSYRYLQSPSLQGSSLKQTMIKNIAIGAAVGLLLGLLLSLAVVRKPSGD